MAEAQPQPRSIAQKLLAASREVETVEKRGRNVQQKYDYALAEDVASAASKALAAQGLIVTLECLEAHETPTTSQRGGQGLIVKAVCQLAVIDPESGEVEKLQTIGYGADYPGDKAIYKAMTGARKYGLIHLLGIPIGDEPEQAQTQADESKVGRDIATRLAGRAWAVPSAKDNLRLAIGHVAGRDVGALDTEQAAVEAIQSLTFAEAERLDVWIKRKTDEEPDEGS
jgi:hypothetical protein